MELSMPLGVSAIRGVALPERGLRAMDFVTTAPISLRGKNCASSFPELAQPLAVKMGNGKFFEPNLQR
jgi:hypothetical protein